MPECLNPHEWEHWTWFFLSLRARLDISTINVEVMILNLLTPLSLRPHRSFLHSVAAVQSCGHFLAFFLFYISSKLVFSSAFLKSLSIEADYNTDISDFGKNLIFHLPSSLPRRSNDIDTCPLTLSNAFIINIRHV
jgi:hypothetical protein